MWLWRIQIGDRTIVKQTLTTILTLRCQHLGVIHVQVSYLHAVLKFRRPQSTIHSAHGRRRHKVTNVVKARVSSAVSCHKARAACHISSLQALCGLPGGLPRLQLAFWGRTVLRAALIQGSTFILNISTSFKLHPRPSWRAIVNGSCPLPRLPTTQRSLGPRMSLGPSLTCQGSWPPPEPDTGGNKAACTGGPSSEGR